jgi:hypothetical protein
MSATITEYIRLQADAATGKCMAGDEVIPKHLAIKIATDVYDAMRRIRSESDGGPAKLRDDLSSMVLAKYVDCAMELSRRTDKTISQACDDAFVILDHASDFVSAMSHRLDSMSQREEP